MDSDGFFVRSNIGCLMVVSMKTADTFQRLGTIAARVAARLARCEEIQMPCAPHDRDEAGVVIEEKCREPSKGKDELAAECPAQTGGEAGAANRLAGGKVIHIAKAASNSPYGRRSVGIALIDAPSHGAIPFDSRTSWRSASMSRNKSALVFCGLPSGRGPGVVS